MSKPAPIINRAETGAAIDRAMEALKALKGQLKAKKLSGRAMTSLLEVATDELRIIAVPINEQHSADLDAAIAHYRSFTGVGGEDDA